MEVVAILDGYFAKYRRIDIESFIKHGCPPEKESDATSFRKFVHRGLTDLNLCNPLDRLVGFLTNLLRAYIHAGRRDLEGVYRYLALAWLTFPKKLRTSASGYELFRLTAQVRYLWKLHKLTGEQPRERFWNDMLGKLDETIAPHIRPFFSYIWYPVMLMLADGLKPAEFRPRKIDEIERHYYEEAVREWREQIAKTA
jgi:hypothetical protein